MKECYKCKVEKSLTEFYKHPQMREGRLNICKPCHNKVSAKYNKENPEKCAEIKKQCCQKRPEFYKALHKKWRKSHPESRVEEFRKYKERYPEKVEAHQRVMVEVRTGRMKPSIFCEGCGLPAKTEGHHEDYNQPLNVDWLCRKCHTELHSILV